MSNLPEEIDNREVREEAMFEEAKAGERKIRFMDDETALVAGEYVLKRYAAVFRRLAENGD